MLAALRTGAMLYRTDVAKQFVGYTDANWAENASDRRSTKGFSFSLGSPVIAIKGY